MSKILPRLIFDCFTVRPADFNGSAYCESKDESAMLWSNSLLATFFAWTTSFNCWFHHEVTFLPLFTTPSRFCLHTQTEMKLRTYSCFEWPPLHLHVRCAFREFFWNKDDRLFAKFFLAYLSDMTSTFIRQDRVIRHACVGPGGFSRCKLQTSRWWSVDSSAPLLARMSNIEQIKSAETMQKPIRNNAEISTRCFEELAPKKKHKVYFCTSLF